MTTGIPKPTPRISIEHIHATLLTEINTLIKSRNEYPKFSNLWNGLDMHARSVVYMFGPLADHGNDSQFSSRRFYELQRELRIAANVTPESSTNKVAA
jgi:hypothetical protein